MSQVRTVQAAKKEKGPEGGAAPPTCHVDKRQAPRASMVSVQVLRHAGNLRRRKGQVFLVKRTFYYERQGAQGASEMNRKERRRASQNPSCNRGFTDRRESRKQTA